MKREKHILCIYLPQWSIDIVRRKQRVQQPILLFDKKRAEQIVVRCCRVSAKKGVYPGMSITHARALVSGAHLQAFEAGPEISALNSLGRWASRFSPLVQIESPSASKEKLYGNSELYYGISIDITASVKLFGGLSSLLRTMQSALNRFGIHHQLAVAPTLGAAWALARFSQQQVVGFSPQEINEVVGNLPLAALRLSPTISNSLKEIGVKNVAEVIKLPPKQLNSRFGLELVNRINQLTGKLNEPINAIKTKHTPQVSISFLSPVSDINNLLLATKKAFVELVDSIQASGEAARCFTVSYKRYRAPDISKELFLHFPSNNSEHLWSLIKPRLEQINLGHGIERVRVCAKNQVRYEPTLSAMWKEFAKEGSSPQHIGELIDTLMAQLGEDNIVVHHQISSHLPEKALSFLPASIDSMQTSRDSETQAPNRPSKLFKKPERISALSMLPDKPPHKIQWDKRVLTISIGLGPERIAPEWWNRKESYKHPNSRDYFTLQTSDGTWLWVFRDLSTSHWYLQGVYA